MDIEVLYLNIEVRFDTESILYRRLLRYRSWKSYTDIEVLYFDIEVWISKFSLILSGLARAGAGLQTANAGCSSVLKSPSTDCSAGISLQPSFWHRISNSTLSGWRDGVAGEAEAKEASRMAPMPQVAQAELTAQTALCPWFHTGQDVSFYLQNGMHSDSVSRWRIRGKFEIPSANLWKSAWPKCSGKSSRLRKEKWTR